MNVETIAIELLREMAEKLRVYLNSYCLENYGYDWRDFRRLRDQRYRCKRAFNDAADTTIVRNALATERLTYDNGQWNYVVGQSANEEITNLMASLGGVRTRGWLS